MGFYYSWFDIKRKGIFTCAKLEKNKFSHTNLWLVLIIFRMKMSVSFMNSRNYCISQICKIFEISLPTILIFISKSITWRCSASPNRQKCCCCYWPCRLGSSVTSLFSLTNWALFYWHFCNIFLFNVLLSFSQYLGCIALSEILW